MRGALKSKLDVLDGRRITPAHAGSTHSSYYQSHPLKDHPRTCGEHTNETPENMRFFTRMFSDFIQFGIDPVNKSTVA